MSELQKVTPIQLHFDIESLKVKLPKPKKQDVQKATKEKDLESQTGDDVKVKQESDEYKTILSNIKGTFEPGTLTAIMGSR
jgi:ABC-type transport system involved in Fe-S cluster assembly fused permease/ATPase subunit